MTASEERLRHYLRKVTLDLQESRRRLAEVEERSREPIAVIAMACRYPGGVQTPDDMWELVSSGVDAIGPYPSDRGWESMHEVISTKSSDLEQGYAQSGGFIADVAGFDSNFFGISPREALLMDPQQRMLLEVTWEAIERAGIAASDIRGSKTGVFMGATGLDYLASIVQTDNDILTGPDSEHASADDLGHIHGDDQSAIRYIPDDGDATHMMTGSMSSVLSGRLAYAFGMEGPAITVDTACSSSLVAIHQACQSLRSGESNLAVAGGTLVMSTPMLLGMTRLAAAPDGRCKAFAEAADGTGWGEGIGIVLLERLSDARRNGHPVAAVIRGSAINQDGASNGMAAPNGVAQQQVIRAALVNAQLSAAAVDVVEAHGTGTALGDPIEAGALLAAYGPAREPNRPLFLGSIKSNIGHAGPAAGIAGLIKLVMAIRHGVLPPTLHAQVPSSQIDWSSGAMRLLTEPIAWQEDRPRIGAVSSFGVSGTNAHVIVSAPPPAEMPEPARGTVGVVPWVVSARTATALETQAARVQDWLSTTKADPVDAGYSLASRVAFKNRAVIIGSVAEDVSAGLDAIRTRTPDPRVALGVSRNPGPAVFIYPGHGGQWVGMGRELLASSAVFARSIATCEAALQPWTGWSVSAVLRQDAGAPALETVDIVQPALFAIMVSLTELWKSFGVVPAAVVGHSQGEVAAAYVAGALSLDDAAKIVAIRSKLLATLTNGTMMSVVGLTGAELEERVGRFGDDVAVAVVNSPEAVTLSGVPTALAELGEELTALGARVRYVRGATGAGHSAAVDKFRDEVLEKFAGMTPRSAEVPFYSAVVGDELDTSALDAQYWFRNMRSTVRFDSAMRSAIRAGWRTFVEPGPHPVLLPAVEQVAGDMSVHVLTGGTLHRGQDGLTRFYTSAAELYVEGVAVDWRAAFASGGAQHRPDLPTYPFQRQRYWLPDELGAGAPRTESTDSTFWNLVERGDANELASLLGGADTDALATVLPQLASWWQRANKGSRADKCCYRTTFERITRRPLVPKRGTWYVAVPSGCDDERVSAIVAAVRDHLGDARPIELPGDATEADVTACLRDSLTVERSAGMLSLLEGVPATVRLLRALGEVGFDRPLWCATTSAVTVRPDDADDPELARLWGIGRVAAVEFAERWGGSVDLPESLDADVLASLCTIISHGDDDQVAVRSDGVFARRVQRIRPSGGEAPRPWGPAGTVLVTGGAGELTEHVARWLTDAGAQRVVPALDRSGADLGWVIDDIGAELTAVVHIEHPTSIAALDDTEIAETMSSLDALLGDRDLDAFVLLSPAAGAWGETGGAGVAVTNAYAAAVAHRRRSRGLAATAIGWDAWPRNEIGTKPMDFDTAVTAMWHAVESGEAEVVVAEIDWEQPESVFARTRAGTIFVDLPEFRRLRSHREQAVPDHSSLLAKLSGSSRVEQERLLVELIRNEIATVLRYESIDDIEATTPFLELGMDSISGLQIRKRIVSATGLEMPIRMILEHPTPEELAAHLAAGIAEQTS
ncbi:acyltransferase domain-containing protein [Nocardia sp. NPDC052112]|uniref:type I polyketide synthase n=1 Tax=Nocardia sp. NPDC052112 TaxID=3155646 RepID=UPI00341AEE9A